MRSRPRRLTAGGIRKSSLLVFLRGVSALGLVSVGGYLVMVGAGEGLPSTVTRVGFEWTRWACVAAAFFGGAAIGVDRRLAVLHWTATIVCGAWVLMPFVCGGAMS